MGLSDLFSKATELMGDENVQAAVKKVASNKKLQAKISKAKSKVDKSKAVKTIKKVAAAAGIDVSKILTLIMKNQDVVSMLGKIGLKKSDGTDPTSVAVQKLVGTLKTTINKASGVKVDDKSFASLVTKLMGNATVKNRVEGIAGTGVATFIKKAVAEYIS